MSTFPVFFSMIKCRQGGAARLKYIIVLGCMSVEWVSEGGLQRRRKSQRMQDEACVISDLASNRVQWSVSATPTPSCRIST